MSYLKALLLLSFLCVRALVLAQENNVDSLRLALESSPHDTAAVNTLNQLGTLLFRSDPGAAIQYSTEALEQADYLGFKNGMAAALKNIGLGNYMLGNYADAVKNWESSLDIYEALSNEQLVANLIGNLGSVYYTMGQPDRAIEYYLRSLKIAEEIDDKSRIATILLNIGSVYSEQASSLDSSLSYYQKAMRIGEDIDDPVLLGLGYMNIGQIFYKMEAYDSALYYFETSQVFNESKIDIASSLNDIGRIYAVKKQYERAISYHEEALEMARAENAQMEIVKILLSLASIQGEMGKPKLAIGYYEEAKTIARGIGLNYELSSAYEGLAESYGEIRDYRNAYKFLALKNDIDNTIYKLETEDKTQNLMFSYQLDKKQSEIEILEQESIIDQLKSKRQRGMLIGISLFGLLVLVLAGGFYNRMLFVRRTKLKIELQRDQIEAQRDEIQAQHDLVMNQKELITDSINYARRIQAAILPSEGLLGDVLPDHFALLKPKDIVSGDFYWVREVQDHVVIVAADCTGHGVPGAFMSMLGMTLLNDLIGDRCYDAPSAILDRMRVKIKELLDQDGKDDEQKDGMDAALVVLNKKTREIHYAGANNPLYIVRSKHVTSGNGLEEFSSAENEDYRLFELKADKQPIGTHWEETPFKTRSVYLDALDTIYLFSDGFVDQFGGANRKKYKAVNFKKLLLSIQEESMDVQKEILDTTLENWRGNIEQIDDVSVIGVKIS